MDLSKEDKINALVKKREETKATIHRFNARIEHHEKMAKEYRCRKLGEYVAWFAVDEEIVRIEEGS